MKDPDKEKEEDVEIQIEKEPVKEEVSIEVDLDKKEEKKEEKVPQSVSKEDFDKAVKRMEYQARQAERARKELEDLKLSVKNIRLAPIESDDNVETEDPIDKEAQKDWKKAVRMLAKQEMEEERKREKEFIEKRNVENQFEQSLKRVRDKYPKIDDEATEEAQILIEVINENPSLKNNPYGPELAMYKMEEKMRGMGKILSDVKPIVDKEVNRRVRVNASISPNGTRGEKTNKYVLTSEQKEYCDHHNIPYDKYARTAKQLESGESLEA